MDTSEFSLCLLQLLQEVRQWKWQPLRWHNSLAVPIDKEKGSGCSALRLINLLDPVGKAYNKVLWSRRPDTERRHYSCGFLSGRRREQAMAQQWCLGWRLHKAKRGHATVFYDVRNAFPSPKHSKLTRLKEERLREQDAPLAQQRHQYATMQIQAPDKELLVQIGSGSLQGDGSAPEEFTELYNEVVDGWMLDRTLKDQGREFEVEDPLSGEVHNVGSTVYADDLATKIMAEDEDQLAHELRTVDAALDESLEELGMAQHPDKKEIVVRFYGKGASRSMRKVYKEGAGLPGRVCRAARYLGGRYHHSGAYGEELHARRQAVVMGWHAFGRFWRSRAPRRQKILAYRAMIYGHALSGLVAMQPPPGELRRLQRVVHGYARSMLGQEACQMTEDEAGGRKYHKISDLQLQKLIRTSTLETKLRVQRLRWWQHIVRFPEQHAHLISTIFGTFEWEEYSTLDHQGRLHEHANPWARELVKDIEYLGRHDGGQWVDQMDSRPMMLFTDEDIRQQFLIMDVTVLRWASLSHSIPPHGTVLAEATAQEEHTVQWQCTHVNNGGIRCTYSADTIRQLKCHERFKHGQVTQWWKYVVTNQCPFCERVFNMQSSAHRHVAQRMREGRCGQREGPAAAGCAVLVVPDLHCPTCDYVAVTVAELQAHIREHLFAIEGEHGGIDVPRDGRPNDGAGRQLTLRELWGGMADVQRHGGRRGIREGVLSGELGDRGSRSEPCSPCADGQHEAVGIRDGSGCTAGEEELHESGRDGVRGAHQDAVQAESWYGSESTGAGGCGLSHLAHSSGLSHCCDHAGGRESVCGGGQEPGQRACDGPTTCACLGCHGVGHTSGRQAKRRCTNSVESTCRGGEFADCSAATHQAFQSLQDLRQGQASCAAVCSARAASSGGGNTPSNTAGRRGGEAGPGTSVNTRTRSEKIRGWDGRSDSQGSAWISGSEEKQQYCPAWLLTSGESEKCLRGGRKRH